MATSVELYEALKPKLGAEPAKMLTEAMAATDRMVTKDDFGALKDDFGALKDDFGALKDDFNELRRDLLRIETRLLRWLLTLMVPVIAGVWTSALVALLKS